MPKMGKTETLPQKFGGAKIANILYLPDKIELTGDTIILANYLVFAGKKVEIVGYDDLLVFPMEAVLSDNNDGAVAKNDSSARFIKTRYGSETALHGFGSRTFVATMQHKSISTMSEIKSAHHASGSPEPIAAFVWECVEVDRWYAGCW